MKINKEQGFTVSHLLLTMALISILAATAIGDLKSGRTPVHDAALQTELFLKLARARAMSQTKFITVHPAGAWTLVAESSDSCSGTPENIADLSLTIKRPAQIAYLESSVCFNPRGMASENVSFTINGDGEHCREIEIALGGGTKMTGEGCQ